ncbi:phosphopyruvate hydratase [Microbacterium sp.]|uniref:phosphopyruvate hydratase n=1 Tax=Microbacterium sp. TaxID=51671 RepID=UPI003F707ECC
MNNAAIRHVHAWEALDSRGRPTVACTVELVDGSTGRAVAPSGASVGRHEAVERRDGGPRYDGWGVERAVETVNTQLARLVTGASVTDRRALDAAIAEADGTSQLARFGGNATLALSLAMLQAEAAHARTPLWQLLDGGDSPLIPMPMINILSGGAHAGRAIDLQDFLVVPVGATTFAEAIEWADRVRRAAAELIDRAGGTASLVADEGGLAARLGSNESALALLTEAIENSGLAPRTDAAIAIDVAASQLVGDDGAIHLEGESQTLDTHHWVERLASWVRRYPIVSIEDPLGEDDWDGWGAAAEALDGVQLIGDDLFATTAARVSRAVEEGSANAVLVKVNQAGTVTRAEDVMRLAGETKLATVVSARSGDTEDWWLSDLAVGWRAGQIKVGSTMRGERTSKWNRLLELESLGRTQFAGHGALAVARTFATADGSAG